MNSTLDTLAAMGLSSALLERYTGFLAALSGNDDLPPRVLELCNLHVAALRGRDPEPLDPVTFEQLDGPLRDAAQRGAGDELSHAEAAALTLAGKVSSQWHDLSDAEVRAVATHYGNGGCVTLMTAAAFFDVNYRLGTALPAIARED